MWETSNLNSVSKLRTLPTEVQAHSRHKWHISYLSFLGLLYASSISSILSKSFHLPLSKNCHRYGKWKWTLLHLSKIRIWGSKTSWQYTAWPSPVVLNRCGTAHWPGNTLEICGGVIFSEVIPEHLILKYCVFYYTHFPFMPPLLTEHYVNF